MNKWAEKTVDLILVAASIAVGFQMGAHWAQTSPDAPPIEPDEYHHRIAPPREEFLQWELRDGTQCYAIPAWQQFRCGDRP